MQPSTTMPLPCPPSTRPCRRPLITPTQTTTVLRQPRQPLPPWARPTLPSSSRMLLQRTPSRYPSWSPDNDRPGWYLTDGQLMHHLYFPAGPHKEDLLPYQRAPHDFFMSEKLRQDLQKKSEAALQVISKCASSVALARSADLARYGAPAARQLPQPGRPRHY